MSKKLYLLTELEQEIIEQRRSFNKQIIKENNETWLLFNRENDDYIKSEMRKKLAKGESVIIEESLQSYPNLLMRIFLYFKKIELYKK